MKPINLLLFTLGLFFVACTSSPERDAVKKKTGEEEALVQRYMGEMIPVEKGRADIDRNLIVNLLIDSLWNFQKTASGIYYNIDPVGEGEHPNLNSKLVCHYRGTLLDGREFDSSYRRNRPLEFQIGQMIAGWQEIMPLMKKGAKGTFIIPSGLAYENRPPKKSIIKPHAVLIFEIELLNFK